MQIKEMHEMYINDDVVCASVSNEYTKEDKLE